MKAEFPMLVTLLGMETEVREEQPEKAETPILVTLSPITYSSTCEPNMLLIRDVLTISFELSVTDVREGQG